MPIYEFFCKDCNTIFNFFSRRINTTAIPSCPDCGRALKRQMSIFSTIGRAGEGDDDQALAGMDEKRLEQALGELARKAESLDEDDPRQAAGLMREFSARTGLGLGEGMEEALARMEAGEDPERIERELGDVLEDDDLFGSVKGGKGSGRRGAPRRDETLYEL